MDVNIVLQIIGILAGVSIIIVAYYVVTLVCQAKRTIERCNKVLQEISPLFISTQKSVEKIEELGEKTKNLVEEINVLPPAIKELVFALKDIFQDLSEDIKGTISKIDSLVEKLDENISAEILEVLNQIQSLSSELKKVVSDVHKNLAKTGVLFNAVEEVGQSAKLIAEVFSKNVKEAAIEAGAVAAGVRTTLKVLKQKFISGGVKDV